MPDLTLLSVEFREYNTAFEFTQNRILNNTIGDITIYDEAINSATNSAVNIDLPSLSRNFFQF